MIYAYVLVLQTNNNHDEDDMKVDKSPGVDQGQNNNTAETKLGKLFFTVKYSFEKNALGESLYF